MRKTGWFTWIVRLECMEMHTHKKESLWLFVEAWLSFHPLIMKGFPFKPDCQAKIVNEKTSLNQSNRVQLGCGTLFALQSRLGT
jgi:hypothetical protein